MGLNFKTPYTIQKMLTWLQSFFSSAPAKTALILMPDASGKTYAGFHSGESLTLVGTAGETVGQLMDRFNTYRGPDEQITELWQLNGDRLPFTTVLTEERRAFVTRNKQ
jgi:hypothetical protein